MSSHRKTERKKHGHDKRENDIQETHGNAEHPAEKQYKRKYTSTRAQRKTTRAPPRTGPGRSEPLLRPNPEGKIRRQGNKSHRTGREQRPRRKASDRGPNEIITGRKRSQKEPERRNTRGPRAPKGRFRRPEQRRPEDEEPRGGGK